MEKDNIDTLFKGLENQFDVEVPNLGHQKRFLDKLNAQQKQEMGGISFKSYWKPLMAVAASLVLCLSFFTIIQNNDPELRDLASVSPELSRTQDFFTLAIESEMANLEAERSPETEVIIEDALKRMQSLEEEYNKLKEDLTISGDDKRIIYAMISNFQTRIDILQKVLESIEDIKQIKAEETSNTI